MEEFTCPSVFHLIICMSALSNFSPTSTSKGLVSLPNSQSHAASDATDIHSTPAGELWISKMENVIGTSPIHF